MIHLYSEFHRFRLLLSSRFSKSILITFEASFIFWTVAKISSSLKNRTTIGESRLPKSVKHSISQFKVKEHFFAEIFMKSPNLKDEKNDENPCVNLITSKMWLVLLYKRYVISPFITDGLGLHFYSKIKLS